MHLPAAGLVGSGRTARFDSASPVIGTNSVGRSASLYLSNLSGDITIKVGSGDDLVVDALKRTPQGADAQNQLTAVTIDAVQQASRVEVRTRYPERGGNIRTSVDFTVTVPSSAVPITLAELKQAGPLGERSR